MTIRLKLVKNLPQNGFPSRRTQFSPKLLVEEGHRRATELLTTMRSILDALAVLLNEKEVINGDEMKQLIAKKNET